MDPVSKDLIVLAIQKALLEMGPMEFEMVRSKLKRDYNQTIEDCWKNPINLKHVLCELFGNAYEDILFSIDNSFKKINMNEDLENFMRVMKS